MSKWQALLCPADAAPAVAISQPEAPPSKEDIPDVVAIATGVEGVIHPQEVMGAVKRRRGALLDVREGEGLRPLDLDHYRISLTDIEKFMAGRLGGEQVQDFVSTLIYLASKWRAAYVVGTTDNDAHAAVRHLARLGFTDSAVVVGGASGLYVRANGCSWRCASAGEAQSGAHC